MATSTAHPNHQLISSEDVEGTNVYKGRSHQVRARRLGPMPVCAPLWTRNATKANV